MWSIMSFEVTLSTFLSVAKKSRGSASSVMPSPASASRWPSRGQTESLAAGYDGEDGWQRHGFAFSVAGVHLGARLTSLLSAAHDARASATAAGSRVSRVR